MNTVARKLVHIAFGVFALLLRWLPTAGAAAMAGGAVLFNLFALPYLGGRKIARTERGYDLGIVIYPVAVLALILAFPSRPAIAGVVWIILAFGDGFATLVGQHVPSAPVPWNAGKSVLGTVAFIITALPSALFLAHYLGLHTRGLWVTPVIAFTVILCALVETLPLHVDDNITVPLAGALVMSALVQMRQLPDPDFSSANLMWVGANSALAVAGYLLRTVTPSGMIGGFALGSIMILFAGWQLYVLLLAFFAVGTVATKIGYRRKAALGIAQERGGRRGFGHAFAKTGVAAILALLIGAAADNAAVLWLAAIASLATATGDTIASEIGPLIGRRAFLPLTFRPVTPGTEGAISIEGTAVGAIAALGISILGVWLVRGSVRWDAVAVSTAAAVIASYIESIIGSWNRKRELRVPETAVNFFNTLTGALIVLLLSSAL